MLHRVVQSCGLEDSGELLALATPDQLAGVGLGLMDECPVIHAGIGASRGSRMRAVSATAFEFISENSQIASVREFMRSLPETLRR